MEDDDPRSPGTFPEGRTPSVVIERMQQDSVPTKPASPSSFPWLNNQALDRRYRVSLAFVTPAKEKIYFETLRSYKNVCLSKAVNPDIDIFILDPIAERQCRKALHQIQKQATETKEQSLAKRLLLDKCGSSRASGSRTKEVPASLGQCQDLVRLLQKYSRIQIKSERDFDICHGITTRDAERPRGLHESLSRRPRSWKINAHSSDTVKIVFGSAASTVEKDVKHLYRPVYGDPEDKKRCRAREAARLKKEFEERLSNRNRRFKKQRRRAGFCDFCNVEYDDYEKHIEQPNHFINYTHKKHEFEAMDSTIQAIQLATPKPPNREDVRVLLKQLEARKETPDTSSSLSYMPFQTIDEILQHLRMGAMPSVPAERQSTEEEGDDDRSVDSSEGEDIAARVEEARELEREAQLAAAAVAVEENKEAANDANRTCHCSADGDNDDKPDPPLPIVERQPVLATTNEHVPKLDEVAVAIEESPVPMKSEAVLANALAQSACEELPFPVLECSSLKKKTHDMSAAADEGYCVTKSGSAEIAVIKVPPKSASDEDTLRQMSATEQPCDTAPLPSRSADGVLSTGFNIEQDDHGAAACHRQLFLSAPVHTGINGTAPQEQKQEGALSKIVEGDDKHNDEQDNELVRREKVVIQMSCANQVIVPLDNDNGAGLPQTPECVGEAKKGTVQNDRSCDETSMPQTNGATGRQNEKEEVEEHAGPCCPTTTTRPEEGEAAPGRGGCNRQEKTTDEAAEEVERNDSDLEDVTLSSGDKVTLVRHHKPATEAGNAVEGSVHEEVGTSACHSGVNNGSCPSVEKVTVRISSKEWGTTSSEVSLEESSDKKPPSGDKSCQGPLSTELDKRHDACRNKSKIELSSDVTAGRTRIETSNGHVREKALTYKIVIERLSAEDRQEHKSWSSGKAKRTTASRNKTQIASSTKAMDSIPAVILSGALNLSSPSAPAAKTDDNNQKLSQPEDRVADGAGGSSDSNSGAVVTRSSRRRQRTLESPSAASSTRSRPAKRAKTVTPSETASESGEAELSGRVTRQRPRTRQSAATMDGGRVKRQLVFNTASTRDDVDLLSRPRDRGMITRSQRKVSCAPLVDDDAADAFVSVAVKRRRRERADRRSDGQLTNSSDCQQSDSQTSEKEMTPMAIRRGVEQPTDAVDSMEEPASMNW